MDEKGLIEGRSSDIIRNMDALAEVLIKHRMSEDDLVRLVNMCGEALDNGLSMKQLELVLTNAKGYLCAIGQ